MSGARRTREARAREDGWVRDGARGRLLGLHLISDDILPNGLVVIRVADLTSAKSPAPTASFMEKVLRARSGFKAPRHARRLSAALQETPSLREAWQVVIAQLAPSSPLITVHREERAPRTCHIGALAEPVTKKLSLRLVKPDGAWEQGTKSFHLDDLTQLGFGGLYEEALALVALPRR